MTHRTIARLVAAGTRQPTAAELFAAVGRDELVNQPSQRRQPARQFLLTATAIYFRLFVPGPDWQFIGAEVTAPGCRLDLVFQDTNGCVRADEIKSGRIEDAATYRSLQTQLERQLRGGRRKWGDDFVGVRAVLLASPQQSFLLVNAGERHNLVWEASGV